MTPFIPPPPCWTARRFHSAGSQTRKLIGLAVAVLSIGAIRPSTSQRAGSGSLPGTHRGSASVTLETGSPMELAGTESPSFAVVQSAAVITRGLSLKRALLGVAAD